MKQKHTSDHIECIKNDSKLPLEITLDAFEFTWNCPAIQQPDYGKVLIRYQPDKKIAETKSLKFYLQRYRYKNAFNEELAHRIAIDFAYYVRPKWLDVTLIQNSRGGIANTCQASYQAVAHDGLLKDYVPKTNFRGGWPMVKEKNGTSAFVAK